MKKVFIAILALVYLTVSSGVALTVHYCMGKVASVDLLHGSDKCGRCGMKTKGGCCKDEFKIVKLSDSHKLITNEIHLFTPVAIAENAKNIFDPGIPTGYHNVFNNHSPPISAGTSLNILHCVFRI